MKNSIPKRQQEKAFFGLMLIAVVTYIVMVINTLYGMEINNYHLALPMLCYLAILVVIFICIRLKLWYDIFTIWFNRKSEDERTKD
jgi:antibiotic biosynthesis monooxygenase (ABM) superfamily enzyme